MTRFLVTVHPLYSAVAGEHPMEVYPVGEPRHFLIAAPHPLVAVERVRASYSITGQVMTAEEYS